MVLGYVQLTIHTPPNPNPTLQKAYFASFSVDRVQKLWVDAEPLIVPQLLIEVQNGPRYEALNPMQLKVNAISEPEFSMNEQIFRL